MREIEVRILDVDFASLHKRILSLGGKHIFKGTLATTNYTVPLGQNLRVREYSDKAFMTYKTVRMGKTRDADEIEFFVGDAKKAKQFLEQLGYKQYLYTVKDRVSYQLGPARLDFDTYTRPRIPSYLEIEATSERAVFAAAKKLGFSKEQCLPITLNKIFKHYNVRL